jgi:CRP-like cAMP-binding protein
MTEDVWNPATGLPDTEPVPTKPDVLARLPLFQRVPVEERAGVAAASRVQAFERGDTIFEEGGPPDFFVTVLEGRVKVYKSLANGKTVILHILSVGDPLGAVAVYEGRPYPASAQALEPSRCLLVPRRAFLMLVRRTKLLASLNSARASRIPSSIRRPSAAPMTRAARGTTSRTPGSDKPGGPSDPVRSGACC